MTKFDQLKASPRKPVELDTETNSEPLDSGKLYTPATLRASMGIGRLIFEGLIAEGLPRTHIKGRYFFSGRLVIEWIESKSEKNFD